MSWGHPILYFVIQGVGMELDPCRFVFEARNPEAHQVRQRDLVPRPVETRELSGGYFQATSSISFSQST
jgi:hypothetical protein